MSMVVIFTSNNARIIKNPDNLEELKKLPNVAVDPDLSAVKGVPPHLWKLLSGNIIRPLTYQETLVRMKSIGRFGVDNNIKKIAKFRRQVKFDWLNLILVVISISCLIFALRR